jgi:hypothetical protein
MRFGGAAPDTVTVRDVDKTLLSYLDDVTKLKVPDTGKSAEEARLEPTEKTAGAGSEAGTGNEEDDLDALGFKKKVALEMRKANDLDGEFGWKDRALKCPVRQHDFRLFEFQLQDSQR